MTNAEARFNNSLRPRKPQGSLGRTAQDGHLDFHTAPELCEIFRHGPIIIYTRLPAGGTCYPICMFRTNSERLIGISDAFFAFVYGYPSCCPRAHCTPNKSVTTLRYTRRPGPILYRGHACRHLPSAVPWISEDRLLYSLSLLQ